MMVKRAMIGQDQMEIAKGILHKGLANIRGEIKSGDYLKYIHSKECTSAVKALSRYIKFVFIKPSSGIPLEDKGNSIVLTPTERQELLEFSYTDDVNDLSDAPFYDYIKANSLESKMNSAYGSVQVRFSVDLDAVEQLGYTWDYENFTAVEVPFINFILPYWFNFVKFDQYTVNEESKPDITVGEVAKILLETGMSYGDKEKDKSYDLLFEEEMKFVLIDEIENLETTIEREWKKGKGVLAALEKDNLLMLKSILSEPSDYLLDFPQGNSLISMAVKYKAENCIDFLLQTGASLWRTPGGTFSNLSVEAHRTVFWSLIKSSTNPSFAWYQFYMEYMKKEVLLAKQSGKDISYLEEKVDLLTFQLTMENRWDRRFFSKYIYDFIYSVLDEDAASACVVANFYNIEEVSDLFLASLRSVSKKRLSEVLLKNINNLYLIYRVTKNREISPIDVIVDGKNLRQILEFKFSRSNELIRQINTFWKK